MEDTEIQTAEHTGKAEQSRRSFSGVRLPVAVPIVSQIQNTEIHTAEPTEKHGATTEKFFGSARLPVAVPIVSQYKIPKSTARRFCALPGWI